MKILMLGWEFPPHNSGGLGVACQGLAEALSEKGVEVIFVLPKRFKLHHDTIRLLFTDNVKFSVLEVDTVLTPYMTGAEYMRKKELDSSSVYAGNLLGEVLRYAQAVRSIAKREDFDVIHAHDWLAYCAGIEAKRVSGKPLILHVHATGMDQAGMGPPDPKVYAIEREAFEIADGIITVSGYTKRIVKDYYHTPQDKIYVVHNGVNAGSHEGDRGDLLSLKRAGNKLVLFVGRLSLHKGPDYFLQVAKKVISYHPNTYFVVSGSGEMEYQLIEQAASLGLAEKVFFVGFVRGKELDKLYRAADVYVLPSVSEPFGITPLESLINGTPVIVSKQSGVSEVLKHALKVDFWDVDEMTNQIVSVLRNPPLRSQLAKLGGGEAHALTWGRAAEKCSDVYKRVINKVGLQSSNKLK